MPKNNNIDTFDDIDKVERDIERKRQLAKTRAGQKTAKNKRGDKRTAGEKNAASEKKVAGRKRIADNKKATNNKHATKRNSTGKMILKVLGIILGIGILAILIYGIRLWLSYNGFLDKITGNDPETKEYSVIVLNSSNTNDVRELERKSLGFLKTDPKAGNAEQHLQSVVKFEASYYDDLATMSDVLNNRISDGIVLDSEWISALDETSEGAMKNARVIYTFTITLDSEDVPIEEKDITKEPFAILISGSDSRAGVKATARSDVNIVAVVNPAKGKILLVSIPRDTYVQLHGTTGLKDKLTHAGVYGINMSRQTIEDFLGIKINDTLKVSFETVVKVVDQLDGIEIESDKEMTLKAEGKDKTCHYTVGKQMVDGDCALRFARERKSYETGDRHRGENQQQVITSIIGKLSSAKQYVLKLPTILDIAADSFETSLSRDEISSFIRMQLSGGTKWQVKSIAIDGTGTMLPTYSMGANLPLYVMIPSDATVAEAQKLIDEYLK